MRRAQDAPEGSQKASATASTTPAPRPTSSPSGAAQRGPGRPSQRRGLDHEGPACNYCGMDVDDLAIHIRDHCRETFPNRYYPDMARVDDMVFSPLGRVSAADAQRRLNGLARVQALYRQIPNDSPVHRKRRKEYEAQLARTLEVKGSMAGDSQTGGIVFIKEN